MKHTYRVLRPMVGEKPYSTGQTRELSPAEAKHLVELGVLKDLGPVKDKAESDRAKAAQEPANKQAPAHANKSARKGE